ncbi:MAG: response regulator [Collimonas sp.]|uniref:response regulator n=1 Tax=Collimonas sp. TaxID=1963772 RepID=UPI003263E076
MKNILVVDDNPLNSNLAKVILTRAGYSVHVLTCASDALHYLNKNLVDVILTDIGMRDINGREFCHIVKTRLNPFAPRVVAYTAFAMEEELASFRAAGFDAIVVKPASRVQILAAVDPDYVF